MAKKLWTAEEMETLTHSPQRAIFDESVVMDLDEVPAAFLARVRADAGRLIAARDARPTD